MCWTISDERACILNLCNSQVHTICFPIYLIHGLLGDFTRPSDASNPDAKHTLSNHPVIYILHEHVLVQILLWAVTIDERNAACYQCVGYSYHRVNYTELCLAFLVYLVAWNLLKLASLNIFFRSPRMTCLYTITLWWTRAIKLKHNMILNFEFYI